MKQRVVLRAQPSRSGPVVRMLRTARSTVYLRRGRSSDHRPVSRRGQLLDTDGTTMLTNEGNATTLIVADHGTTGGSDSRESGSRGRSSASDPTESPITRHGYRPFGGAASSPGPAMAWSHDQGPGVEAVAFGNVGTSSKPIDNPATRDGRAAQYHPSGAR